MRQRVFTGVVTQLQDHHGTVDRDVRFAMSAVVGRAPLVGEKVLVKAVQDPSQSVKWTAQRVQVLNGQPFKSPPPPLLHSATPNLMPSILGNKRQPLLKSPKIPPLIPGMQPIPGGMLQMPHHQKLPWSAPWGGGSRKRHNEVVSGRRGRHWEEAGGSWGGDNAHQKRRRWKAPFEEETSKKSSSQTGTSSPLFSFFPRDSQACDNLELQRRYPHLHAPPCLFHVQLCWTESFPPSNPLPLAGPCHFHVGSGQPRAEVTPAPDSTDHSIFSVKVLLLSLPAIDDFYTQCCNSTDGKAPGDAVHPSALFKFLLLDKAGELQLPGGSWCKEDGSNPAKDSNTIVRTAVRCVMEQTDLDLSACSQWHKMAELRLLSGDETETVVLLMPDVWNLMPTTEEWAKLKEAREEDESPLPDVPSLVVQPSAGFTLSTVSLASILEPRTSPSRDAFEVGLASELFSEMLQRDFGLQLYHSLCSLPQTPPATLPDFEMQAEDSSAALDGEAKKTSKDVAKKEDAKTTTIKEEEEEEMEMKMEEEPEQSEHQAEIQEETESHTEGEEALSDDIELPRRVLLSWVFFDRQLSGFLREEDVQNILLSLGLYLTTAQAQDLTRKMSVDGKCMYPKLCSRWTDSDEVACDLSAQGNKSLLPGLPRKEKGSTRRSSSNPNPEVVNYKGTVLNIPNLLQHLESSKAAQQQLEKRLADLQAMLEAAKARPDSDEQEKLKSRLDKVEALNKTYEKTLKENAGHMLTVIEKMQKMVDQTTSLTRTKDGKADKD